MESYPDAKVLLGVRDPERLVRGTRSTIYELGGSTPAPLLMSFAFFFLLAFGVLSARAQ